MIHIHKHHKANAAQIQKQIESLIECIWRFNGQYIGDRKCNAQHNNHFGIECRQHTGDGIITKLPIFGAILKLTIHLQVYESIFVDDFVTWRTFRIQ